ncbi:MAG: hypothetical protein ACOCUT_01220 [bacterium]
MNTFETVINNIIGTLNIVVYLIIALGVVSFLYGIVLYISRAGDEGKRKEGIKYIMYGIIGLFVMVSVWALVAVLSGTIGETVGIPQFS